MLWFTIFCCACVVSLLANYLWFIKLATLIDYYTYIFNVSLHVIVHYCVLNIAYPRFRNIIIYYSIIIVITICTKIIYRIKKKQQFWSVIIGKIENLESFKWTLIKNTKKILNFTTITLLFFNLDLVIIRIYVINNHNQISRSQDFYFFFFWYYMDNIFRIQILLLR